MSELTQNEHELLISLREEITNNPDFDRIHKARFIEFSKTLFDLNTKDLIDKLKWGKDRMNTFQLWMYNNRPYLYQYQIDIIRLLQNFITSAKSLVSHSRRHYVENYKTYNEFQEYEEETKRRFSNNTLVQFVHDLRNYYQHFSPTMITVSFNIAVEGKTQHNIYLEKSKLLEWTKWNKTAKQFLSNSKDEIELLDLVNKYFKIVNEFYDWVLNRLYNIHKDEVNKLNELEMKIGFIASKEIPKKIKDNIKLISDRGGDPEDIFCNLIPHENFIKILSIEPWDDRMSTYLEQVQIYRKLPTGLLNEVKETFNKHYV